LIDFPCGFNIRLISASSSFCSSFVRMQVNYLLSGRAKLFLSHENGRISLINFLNAPCFIGEMELLGAHEATKRGNTKKPLNFY